MESPSSARLPPGMNGGALDYFQVVFTCLVFLALCPEKLDEGTVGTVMDKGGAEGARRRERCGQGAGEGALSANHPQTLLRCLVAGSVLGTGACGE